MSSGGQAGQRRADCIRTVLEMEAAIREATEADFEQILELFSQGDHLHERAIPQVFTPTEGPPRSLDFLLGAIRRKDNALLVAEERGTASEGRVIGFLHALVGDVSDYPGWTERRYIYVSNVVVNEDYRGRHIGSLLMDAVERWAVSIGVDKMELTVYGFNDGAHAMYHKRGYTDLSHRMWKHLDVRGENES